MLNKIIAVLAAITISVAGVPLSALANEETSEISVYVNGEKIEFDQEPVIKNDRLLVPFRAIFEALNATVNWKNETQTVTARLGTTVITFKVGDDLLTAGNK